jgi:enoyl-CoA hydratase/carnithine racemase
MMPHRTGLGAPSQDSKLAALRVDRPPLNAFDQATGYMFDAVTASLHTETLYRAVIITGSVGLER